MQVSRNAPVGARSAAAVGTFLIFADEPGAEGVAVEDFEPAPRIRPRQATRMLAFACCAIGPIAGLPGRGRSSTCRAVDERMSWAKLACGGRYGGVLRRVRRDRQVHRRRAATCLCGFRRSPSRDRRRGRRTGTGHRRCRNKRSACSSSYIHSSALPPRQKQKQKTENNLSMRVTATCADRSRQRWPIGYGHGNPARCDEAD